jgi:hypothetical protein
MKLRREGTQEADKSTNVWVTKNDEGRKNFIWRLKSARWSQNKAWTYFKGNKKDKYDGSKQFRMEWKHCKRSAKEDYVFIYLLSDRFFNSNIFVPLSFFESNRKKLLFFLFLCNILCINLS